MNRDTSKLNNIRVQIDPTGICETFHSEYTFFPENHGTVSITRSIIGRKKILTNKKNDFLSFYYN